jgi:hypothetical protein
LFILFRRIHGEKLPPQKSARKQIVCLAVYLKMSIDPEAKLQLEHHRRIQSALTSLVERHHSAGISDPDDFIATVISFEEVHIVTSAENYSARRAKGDYAQAGIELVDFETLTIEDQLRLWRTMLKGRVENHAVYNPNHLFGESLPLGATACAPTPSAWDTPATPP